MPEPILASPSHFVDRIVQSRSCPLGEASSSSIRMRSASLLIRFVSSWLEPGLPAFRRLRRFARISHLIRFCDLLHTAVRHQQLTDQKNAVGANSRSSFVIFSFTIATIACKIVSSVTITRRIRHQSISRSGQFPGRLRMAHPLAFEDRNRVDQS